MNLKNVYISKAYNGGYTGSAEFSNEIGEVKLTLLPEHVDLILNACSEALIKSSKQVADEMSVKVIDYFDKALLETEAGE